MRERAASRMYSLKPVLLFGILLFMPCYGYTQGFAGVGSEEKHLIKYLLENYKHVGIVGRPVFNASETVRVNFGLSLIKLLDVNVEKETLTTNMWVKCMWNDVLLKWNPEDYGGIDHVRVPINQIWSPDIVPYESAEPTVEMFSAMALVSSDGTVLFIPSVKLTTFCSLHPKLANSLETQKCDIKFGSWTYDGYKLDIDLYDGMKKVDVSDYIKSNRWELVDTSAKKNVKHYPCCEEPYPNLEFTLKLRRI